MGWRGKEESELCRGPGSKSLVAAAFNNTDLLKSACLMEGGAQAFLRTLWRICPAPWAKNQSLGVSHQQVTWSDLCLRKVQVEGRGRKTRSEVPMVVQGCGR